MLITGDDILIEYVDRVIQRLHCLKSDDMLQVEWREAMDKFSHHYVWHSKEAGFDGRSSSEQMGVRLQEMQDRRRRLIKYLYKKEGRIDQFEQGYKSQIDRKNEIVMKFSGP